MEISQKQTSLFTEIESTSYPEGSHVKMQALQNKTVKVNRGCKANGQASSITCAELFQKSDQGYVIAENVSNILKTNGGEDFSAILTELSGMGYNAEWRICRASDVGAPHHRARLYLVAYSNNIRLQKGQTFFSYVRETSSQIPWVIGGTSVQTFRGGAWKDQPPVLCLDDGISKGMDYSGPFIRECFHGYGNAIVPEIAIRIFKRIKEIDEMFNPHPSIV